MTFIVTNGTVEYARTVRPADFESRSAKVVFSFMIEEGSDFAAATAQIGDAAIAEVHRRVGIAAPAKVTVAETPVQEAAEPTKAKGRKKSPEPSQPAVNAAAITDDEPGTGLVDLRETPQITEIPAELKEISDKAMTDAVTKARGRGITAIQIREAINSFAPRMSEIPQDKRAAFLGIIESLPA